LLQQSKALFALEEGLLHTSIMASTHPLLTAFCFHFAAVHLLLQLVLVLLLLLWVLVVGLVVVLALLLRLLLRLLLLLVQLLTLRSSPVNFWREEGPQRGSSSPQRAGLELSRPSGRLRSHSRVVCLPYRCGASTASQHAQA
jgi:hypothetical protein